MDKNTILGLLLMGLVIFGFMWLNAPDESQMQQAATENVAKDENVGSVLADSLSAAEINTIKEAVKLYGKVEEKEGKQVYSIQNGAVAFSMNDNEVAGTVALSDTVLPLSSLTKMPEPSSRLLHNAAVKEVREAVAKMTKYSSFVKFVSGDSTTVQLQNNLMAIDLSTKGGVISSVTLKEYTAYSKGNTVPCEIYRNDNNSYGFVLNTHTQRFDTKDFYFKPVQENDSTVLMLLEFGTGVEFGIRYTLPQNSYLVKMEVVQKNMNTIIPANIATMDFHWYQKLARHEMGEMFEERNSGLYYKQLGSGGDVDNLSETSNDREEVEDKLKWIGFKDQFFSSVFIADTYFLGTNHLTSKVIEKDVPDHKGFMKELWAESQLEYSSTNPNPASFHLFFGPNEYKLLASYDDIISPDEDLKLTKMIPLGWSLFRWINTGVIIPIFNFLGTLDLNYGIIILLLTIFIKIVLFPLTYKSYSSQAKMRVLAPDIKEINDKYPGQENALKRNQKMMELYSRAGANPMSGCLPMLLQMPILIAMFSFFPSAIELRGESFLWAKDLSAPDVIFSWDAHIPLISTFFGNHLSLFCLLMTAVNILYTYINMQSNPSSNQMPGMKWMMYLMPVMFLVFFNNYAAGLSYYYFLSLIITIGQTYAFRLIIKEDKVRAKMAENAKKPKKKSGFMARLEEAQRQQQAMLREQQKRKGGK